MPSFIGVQVASLRLSASWSSYPFISNEINQESNQDYEILININVPINATYYYQVLYPNSSNSYPQPSVEAASGYFFGNGQFQALYPPIRVAGRKFKIAIGLVSYLGSAPTSGQIEVWGYKLRVDP